MGGGGGAHGFQGERRGNQLSPTEYMTASLRKTHEKRTESSIFIISITFNGKFHRLLSFS